MAWETVWIILVMALLIEADNKRRGIVKKKSVRSVIEIENHSHFHDSMEPRLNHLLSPFPKRQS